MVVQPGLCRTRSETRILVFSQRGSNVKVSSLESNENTQRLSVGHFAQFQIMNMPEDRTAISCFIYFNRAVYINILIYLGQYILMTFHLLSSIYGSRHKTNF